MSSHFLCNLILYGECRSSGCISRLHPSDHWTGCGGWGAAHSHANCYMLHSGSHFKNQVRIYIPCSRIKMSEEFILSVWQI